MAQELEVVALGPDLAYVIASLANVTASQARIARKYAKWSELAPYFDLPVDLTMA